MNNHNPDLLPESIVVKKLGIRPKSDTCRSFLTHSGIGGLRTGLYRRTLVSPHVTQVGQRKLNLLLARLCHANIEKPLLLSAVGRISAPLVARASPVPNILEQRK